MACAHLAGLQFAGMYLYELDDDSEEVSEYCFGAGLDFPLASPRGSRSPFLLQLTICSFLLYLLFGGSILPRSPAQPSPAQLPPFSFPTNLAVSCSFSLRNFVIPIQDQ